MSFESTLVLGAERVAVDFMRWLLSNRWQILCMLRRILFKVETIISPPLKLVLVIYV